MNYTYLAGTLIALVVLIPAALRIFSRIMNRRLARRLATGPVGLLLKHNYRYAMDLSQMVSTGELSVADAGKLANNWMLQRESRSGVGPR